jgi:hypothetical protein
MLAAHLQSGFISSQSRRKKQNIQKKLCQFLETSQQIVQMVLEISLVAEKFKVLFSDD